MKISYELTEATDNKGVFMQTTESLRQDKSMVLCHSGGRYGCWHALATD